MFPCAQCGSCCRNLDKCGLYAELDRGDGTCRYLLDNRCSIYDERPLLCRIDDCYDLYFHKVMERSEYYRLNRAECRILRKRLRKKEE